MGGIKKKTVLFFLVSTLLFMSGCGLFQLTRFTLTIEINDKDGGRVIASPDRKSYVQGTGVKLEAISKEGWFFQEWKKDQTGNEPIVDITMDSHKIILAEFAQIPEGMEEIVWEIFSAYENAITNGDTTIEQFLALNIFHHNNYSKEEYLEILGGLFDDGDHKIEFSEVSFSYTPNKIIIYGQCKEERKDTLAKGSFEMVLEKLDGEWKMTSFIPEEGILLLPK